MTEEWRVLPDLPYYSVSNLGRVRTKRKVLKQTNSGRGYFTVRIRMNIYDWHSVPVHKLVASVFIRPIQSKEVCHHKDGNKHNNRLDNLEYISQSINLAKAFYDGRSNSNLNTECIKVIRWMLKYGNKSAKKLAEVYKTTEANIRHIRGNKTWTHVTIGGRNE